MKKFENIYQDAVLIKKRLLGKADEQEREELEKRLSECPDLQHLYEELKKEGALKTSFDEYRNYSSKKAYQLFLRQTGQTEAKKRSLWTWWCATAAAIAVIVALTFYASNYILSEKGERTTILPGTQQAQLTLPDGNVIDMSQKEVSITVDDVRINYKKGVLSYQPATNQQEDKSAEEQSVRPNELTTPRGGENTVTLADGTTVHLNAGSRLVYPLRFVGKRRIVRLEGEAYFDVAKDEDHPFVVQTHLGEITVLGTAFNVNAYGDAPVCYTTLVHGKVEFATLNAKTITLSPGEQAIVYADSSMKRVVDLEEYVGWVNGRYVFNNRSLDEIMKTFERWYDIRVDYETPDLRDITYSGSLKRYGTINSFLDALELTGDLTYKISGRNILICGNVEKWK